MSEPIPVDLMPNGLVRFSVGEKRITLRRVKLGEWQTLREAIYQMDDDLADAAEAMKDASDALPADEDGDEKAQRATARQRRKLIRDFQSVRDGLCKAVVVQMLDLLASPEVEEYEIEPWMVTPGFIHAVSQHLQTVPLARGDS
jgi:hypothetical protein